MIPRLPRRAVLALVLLTALAGVSAVSAPASAAGRARILEVESVNGKVQLVVTATGLAAGTTIDPDSVAVTVNGTPLQVQAEQFDASGAAAPQRTAVLVIDTSGSMIGERLTAAKQAAEAFVASVPDDVRLGLVTFDDDARVLVPPTTQHDTVRARIRSLTAQGDTALYDGAVLGVRTAGAQGVRTVLLLSDGLDDGSRTSIGAATTALRGSRIPVSAVALGAEVAGAAPLKSLAEVSGGELVPSVQTSQLAGAFRSAAGALERQLLVTADLPADAPTSGTVALTAQAGGERLSDRVFTQLAAAAPSPPPAQAFGPRPAEPSSTLLESPAILPLALFSLFAALALVVLSIGSSLQGVREVSRTRRSLSSYTLTPGRSKEREEAGRLGESAVARTAVEYAGRVVARRGLEERLSTRLDAAGIPMLPAEWLVVRALSIAGFAGLFLLISGGSAAALLVGFLIGFVLPVLFLKFKESRRIANFLSQLPDTLQLVAGSLSAGYSLPQALDTVVREARQPIAQEFSRALLEARLGMDIEDALEEIGKRMRSKDFDWVVMAIRIQREVGGNLAEVLHTVSATLRERERLRRQVKVLSAEGRLSAYIIGGLPPVFFLYLLLVRGEYAAVLYTDPIGILLLVFVSVLMVIGGFWMRKVVNVEV